MDLLERLSALNFALDYALPALAVFAGYCVLGVAGFGSALLIVPVLAWQWPLSMVVPLILLIEIPAIFLHTGLNFRAVAWSELPPLLPSVLVGALAGFLLMRISNANWLLIVLGIYIAFVAVKGLQGGASATPRPNTQGRPLAGFTMGLVETMFATSGPIVMVWLVRRILDPHRLRATMPATIVLLSTVALLTAAFSGVLQDAQLWRRLAFLLPFALAGIVSGNVWARRVQPERLKPVIYLLLGASGVLLAGGAIVRLLA
jgi:uncharacterized protein